MGLLARPVSCPGCCACPTDPALTVEQCRRPRHQAAEAIAAVTVHLAPPRRTHGLDRTAVIVLDADGDPFVTVPGLPPRLSRETVSLSSDGTRLVFLARQDDGFVPGQAAIYAFLLEDLPDGGGRDLDVEGDQLACTPTRGSPGPAAE